MKRFCVTLLVFGAACSGSAPPPAMFQSNCTVGEPSDELKVTAGQKADGSVILPGGRRLKPAGKLVVVGGFPVNLRVLPGGRYVIVTDASQYDETLRIVDLEAADPTRAVVSSINYPFMGEGAQSPALWYGLALTADGKKLYVSNGLYDGERQAEPDFSKHYNVIDTITISGSPPTLTRVDAEEIRLYFNGTATNARPRMPAGLWLSADEKTLYTANQSDGTLSVIDLASRIEIGRTPELGIAPYDLLVDEGTKVAYVSLWGGRSLGMHAFDEGVVPVDLSNPIAPMPAPLITTGKGPEQLVAANGRVYVASSDEDTIASIDPVSRMATSTPTAVADPTLFGSSPNALAIDAAAGRLYAANAGENAIQAFAMNGAALTSLGRIPTCWYPTAVNVLPDGALVIACAKGLGGGPNDRPPLPTERLAGMLAKVARPTDAELAAGDQIVKDGILRPLDNEVTVTCTPAPGEPKRFPLPPERGGKTPIEHVFFVVRENKTYDVMLGDLEGANGKPSLAIYGESVTPNIHALARRFANLDNFYSNAEESLQGHHWTTAGMLNDYGEKAWLSTWGRRTRPINAFGHTDDTDYITTPRAKPIWQLLDAAGIAYHNYGEVVNVGGAKIPYDVSYPGIYFAMGLTDVLKVGYIEENLKDKTFKLEPFSFIGLPNDHTFGTQPGKQTPESMIADNDEATGRLIDALSHSPYWATSIVFIVEDDPGGTPDHVEEHRSIGVVVSPWVTAGKVSSAHYDYPSMWKTITLLLGTGPMNLNDAYAPAMYDLFATTPDLRPYTFIPRNVPPKTNSADAPLASESMAIDFSEPDTAHLGRILWKAARGADSEPPWWDPAHPPRRTLDEDDM